MLGKVLLPGVFIDTWPHRVHAEWQLPLSGIHFTMMEKLAQPGDGWGGCTSTPFHSIYNHLQSCGVCSSWEGRYCTLPQFLLYPYMYSVPALFPLLPLLIILNSQYLCFVISTLNSSLSDLLVTPFPVWLFSLSSWRRLCPCSHGTWLPFHGLRSLQPAGAAEQLNTRVAGIPYLYCKENPIYVFLFWELHGLRPNFHILWAFYTFPGSVHIFPCSRIGRPILQV